MVANLSSMTGGAGETDPFSFPVLVGRPGWKIELADGKADGKATRIRCISPVGEEAEPLQMVGGGEERVARGLFQRNEPIIGHEHGALADVVPPRRRIVTPALIEIEGAGRRLRRRITLAMPGLTDAEDESEADPKSGK